jgi:plasmid stabilization system protein ParE
MTHRVVILESAEDDIREIRRYVVSQFGQITWSQTYSTLKQTIRRLADFPDSGSRVDELRELNMTQFRQAISGSNRVIYQIADEMVYVHIVCDSRMDLTSLLHRRLLRSA